MRKIEQKTKVLRMRRDGMSLRGIAKWMNVPLSTVKRWCNAAYEERNRQTERLRPYETPARVPSDAPRRRALARRMFRDEIETVPQLAVRFGVTERTMKRWLSECVPVRQRTPRQIDFSEY